MKTNKQIKVMIILFANCCFVFLQNSAVAQLPARGTPTFGAVGVNNYSSDIDRRLNIIQDVLGIQDYGFRYYIPIDTKLLVSLSVKISGQFDKNASRTYQIAFSPEDYTAKMIAPHDSPNGFISIIRSPSPGAESKERDVRWTIAIGRRAYYKFTVPRDIFDGPGFEQMRQCASDTLIMGKDDEVFAYELFQEDKKTEKFSIRMTVRLDTRSSDDNSGVVLLNKSE